jgi:hypothetical protein
MCKKHFFTLVIIIALSLFNSIASADTSEKCKKGPFGVFFALHMEAGMYTPGLQHQEQYWPRLVRVVSIADQFDAKLTLLFNPQWAEFILADNNRYHMVKEWQDNGHEVGLHYHLVTHNDWCGYTNRSDSLYVESSHYQGTVQKMMDLMNQLAAPEPILTACNGPDIVTKIFPFTFPVSPGFIEEIDFPNDIIYDIDGIYDGRISPAQFEFNGRVRYHLRHGVAISESDIAERMEEIASARPDEIIGLVTHESDYDPELVQGVFQYLLDRKIQVHTVRQIMDRFLELR